MSSPDRARGVTLVELMVAMALLLVTMVGGLSIYQATAESFKKGENAAQQQQSVRIAMDKIALDLQMAGFNYNPDGDPTRVDEQIEAAYDTAIVIRADFDAGDVTLSGDPESDFAGDAFETISTGNDEIVAYVLAKPDRITPGSVEFEADVQQQPRDGELETVVIPGVPLVHDDPPYTLYRVTLNNDVSKWNTEDFFEWTVLAENIASIGFRYFDEEGNQINGYDLASTSDDIGGAEAVAGTRSSIHRILIELTGLTPDPDLHWTDPWDSNPSTRAHRKFRLASNVKPRNLGMVGIADLAAQDVYGN